MAQNKIGKRILVVEDESLIGMLIEEALADLGCEVVGVASRIDAALSMTSTLAFDAAILDINLQGVMSFPVADALMARGVPFIFVTGYDSDEAPERFRHAPMIQKPFQVSDLERALRPLLANMS